jgi:hypothetical protein
VRVDRLLPVNVITTATSTTGSILWHENGHQILLPVHQLANVLTGLSLSAESVESAPAPLPAER